MKNKSFLYRISLVCLLGMQTMFALAQTYIVTTSADSDPSQPGQLRNAIEEVNKGNYNRIDFNIPGTNGAPVTIQLVSQLPTITKLVQINGNTQPGYKPNEPSVIIDGSKGLNNNNQGYYYCFRFSTKGSNYSNIECLQIQKFNIGVGIVNADTVVILYNKIISCDSSCIEIFNSDGCVVGGNWLNADKDRSVLYPQPKHAVYIRSYDGYCINNYMGRVGEVLCDGHNIIGYTSGAAIGHDANPWLSNNYNNIFSANIIYGHQTKGIDLKGTANKGISPPAITSISGCAVAGTSLPGAYIELFGRKDINYSTADAFISYVTADKNGNWQANLHYIEYPYIVATQDTGRNTSEFSVAKAITPTIDYTGPNPLNICINKSITLAGASGCAGSFSINYGDGTALTASITHTYTTVGTYTLTIAGVTDNGCGNVTLDNIIVHVDPCGDIIPCINCIGSFNPIPGKKYILSAWVKEKDALPTKVSYDYPRLFVEYPGSTGGTAGPFVAKGVIIDGWQRVSEEFVIPADATQLNIKLNCTTGDCYFDDIRVFPYDGSMKSYVYDPITLRLVAELDERNYATLYEYDEDGKPIRVKKETERGIMTISENRDHTVKK